METSTSRWFAVVAAAALSFAVAACAGAPSDTEGEADGGVVRAEAAERDGSEGTGEHAVAAGSGEEARSEGAGEHGGSEGDGERRSAEGEGEHSGSEGEGEHDSGEEEEESGPYIARHETWDATRRGARLVLSFNPETNAFEGTVENTTGQMLCAVRVEVHLSSGTELGPTERTDLPSGGATDVRLPTAGEGFETWTAHPELSRCSGDQ